MERICGLVAAVFAFTYLMRPWNLFINLCLFFALMVVVIFLCGFHRSGFPLNVQEAAVGFISLPITPLFMMHNLYQGSTKMITHSSRPRLHYWVAFVVLALMFAILLAVTAATRPSGGNEGAPPDPSTHLTRIRVATSKNLWCTLTLIAEAQGFFRAEGLDPQMNYQAAGRLNMDAILGGAADFANVVETNIAYQALNNTKDLTILGRVVSATDYAILTKESAGIERPAELSGKRLAYAQATGAESFVFWFLEKEGVPVSSLTLVPLQPAGVIDHFLGERTEAVATWEPFVSTIRSRAVGLGHVFQTDSAGFAGIMTVATRRSWANANPTVVHAYERAMARSARLVANDASLAQEIVADQAGLPIETVRSIWHRFDFRYLQSTERDVWLVKDVIRRIKINMPAMRNRQTEDVRSYFTMAQ